MHGHSVVILEGIAAIIWGWLVAEIVVRRRVGRILVVVKGRSMSGIAVVAGMVVVDGACVEVIAGSHLDGACEGRNERSSSWILTLDSQRSASQTEDRGHLQGKSVLLTKEHNRFKDRLASA